MPGLTKSAVKSCSDDTWALSDAVALPILREDKQKGFRSFMAALIEAIDIKRKTLFEHEDTPFYCMDVEVNSPTARGGQTLVRVKMRNLLTNAVFEKTFKAGEKFKEPDLEQVDATFLYSDGDGYHFLDQQSFETLTLTENMVGNALDFLVDGLLIQVNKYNGNPIGLELPIFVDLTVTETEPGLSGASQSGSVTKVATLETGLEIRVPLFIKEGEKVKVSTESRESACVEVPGSVGPVDILQTHLSGFAAKMGHPCFVGSGFVGILQTHISESRCGAPAMLWPAAGVHPAAPP